jgi:hypothetical protein
MYYAEHLRKKNSAEFNNDTERIGPELPSTVSQDASFRIS